MVVMGTLTHIITYVTRYASVRCQMDSKQMWLLGVLYGCHGYFDPHHQLCETVC